MMNQVPEELANDIRQRLNSDNIKLPSLPDTVIKVQRLMASDNYSINDIAKILTADLAFATVVMKLANSARFNTTGREIRSMDMAIQRIGATSILQLLITVASRMFFEIKQPELRALMKVTHGQALIVAAAAEQIAHVSKASNPGDTFMASLLHDQGIDLLMMLIPGELLNCTPEQRASLIEMFHREMGARLLNKWALPEPFIVVAQHHGIESPDRPTESMIDCVDVAEMIVHQQDDTFDEHAEADIAAHPAAQRLRLNETQLTSIIMDIEDRMDELRETFAH